jgi:hypothetical protein
VNEPGPAADLSRGVLLEIGGDIGALVVHTTEALLGTEVQVSPATAGRNRVHAVVHERQAGGRRVFAAVFPSLGQGDYVVWDGQRRLARVRVIGGKVTEVAGTACDAP